MNTRKQMYHIISSVLTEAKVAVTGIWEQYHPACVATIGALFGLSLSEYSAILGIVSALFGIVYVVSQLFWGWCKYFKNRREERNKTKAP